MPTAVVPRRRGEERPLARLLRRRSAVAWIVVLGGLLACCLAAPLIAPHDPYEIDPATRFAEPSWAHPFGTDELGRDLFSRILFGGRLAVLITVSATAIALLGGLAWGAFAALSGRIVDEVGMRTADAMMAVPFLLLALILVAAFGSRISSLILILGIIHVPWTARIARTAILGELHSDYIRAARVYGMGRLRMIGSELLPNVVPLLLVQATVVAASILLTEAALSFVGLGVKPPQASWGSLLLEGYGTMSSSMLGVVFPGLFIFVTIWGLNSLADHAESVLDPRDQHR